MQTQFDTRVGQFDVDNIGSDFGERTSAAAGTRMIVAEDSIGIAVAVQVTSGASECMSAASVLVVACTTVVYSLEKAHSWEAVRDPPSHSHDCSTAPHSRHRHSRHMFVNAVIATTT